MPIFTSLKTEPVFIPVLTQSVQIVINRQTVYTCFTQAVTNRYKHPKCLETIKIYHICTCNVENVMQKNVRSSDD